MGYPISKKPKRPKQPSLFAVHEAIKEADGLSAADFMKATAPAEAAPVLYRCRCGNRLELHIQAEAVVCVRCGCRMRPTP